jgi:hypothetical protein
VEREAGIMTIQKIFVHIPDVEQPQDADETPERLKEITSNLESTASDDISEYKTIPDYLGTRCAPAFQHPEFLAVAANVLIIVVESARAANSIRKYLNENNDSEEILSQKEMIAFVFHHMDKTRPLSSGIGLDDDSDEEESSIDQKSEYDVETIWKLCSDDENEEIEPNKLYALYQMTGDERFVTIYELLRTGLD